MDWANVLLQAMTDSSGASFRDWAYVIGLILGSLLLVVVAITWFRKQIFGFGGAGLSVIGLVLLGLSLWTSVNIRVGGWETQLNLVEQRLAQVEQTNVEMSNDLAEVATIANVTKSQFIDLTTALERPRVPTDRLRALRSRVEETPRIDPDLLRRRNLVPNSGR